ncbi:MAG: NAD(P)H-binding protein [Verrucomicrobiales bacterium]|nr:NAD(P)H-binding protein [Verrucomicrobiales bacterium]MCP5528124.1 NAD(P)H-binding protein [Verrucomicrobiales bacterium]
MSIRSGNLLDPDATVRALQGVDAVIHLVGIVSKFGQNTFEKVHVAGTRNVVIQVAELADGRRFLHMSALGTRPDFTSGDHQTKWAAERVVRDSNPDWTIFRPSLVYGSQDQLVNAFRQVSRFSPILPVFGSGRGRPQAQDS